MSGIPSSALPRRQIFIGGCPRSGTTMLGSILGGAPGCVVTPESHFKQTIPLHLGVDWKEGVRRDALLAALASNFRFRIWETSLPTVADLPEHLDSLAYADFIHGLIGRYVAPRDWQVWIDHTPQNIQNPLLLLQLFPDARFIHLVRDPRAVAASLLPLDWGPNDAAQAAIFWAQKMAYGLAAERYLGERCIRVRYEDILADPQETIGSLCRFCGIDYHESMLDGSAFRVPAYTQRQHALVGSRPSREKLESWRARLDIWQVAEIERGLGDLMVMLGYAPVVTGPLPRRPLAKKLAARLAPLLAPLKKRRFKRRQKRWLK